MPRDPKEYAENFAQACVAGVATQGNDGATQNLASEHLALLKENDYLGKALALALYGDVKDALAAWDELVLERRRRFTRLADGETNPQPLADDPDGGHGEGSEMTTPTPGDGVT